MATDKPHDWYDVEIEFDGKTVKGRYYLEKGMVTVFTGPNRKSVQAGGSPDSTARVLLRELAQEQLTSPGLNL